MYALDCVSWLQSSGCSTRSTIPSDTERLEMALRRLWAVDLLFIGYWSHPIGLVSIIYSLLFYDTCHHLYSIAGIIYIYSLQIVELNEKPGQGPQKKGMSFLSFLALTPLHVLRLLLAAGLCPGTWLMSVSSCLGGDPISQIANGVLPMKPVFHSLGERSLSCLLRGK